MVAGPVLVVLIIVVAVTLSSGGSKHIATPASFTYHIVSGSVSSDTATKTFLIPVAVHNAGGTAAAPWCDASVQSGTTPIGITEPHEFGVIAPGATEAVTIKVTDNVAGAPDQVQALCASSQSAANNSSSWSTVTLSTPPTTLSSTHNGFTLRTVCLDADTFSKDVLKAQQTGIAPTSMDADAANLALVAHGYGPPFAAELQTLDLALKGYATTKNITPIDNALTKILDQCTASGV
jgi:hypothetical protein